MALLGLNAILPSRCHDMGKNPVSAHRGTLMKSERLKTRIAASLRIRCALAAAFACVAFVLSPAAHGQTLTLLHSFTGDPDGANPHGDVTVSGSTLIGTTNVGGSNSDGTVFSVPTSGGTATILASFNGTNGTNPEADLTLSGSTLYGTTYGGGSNGDGTVFAYNPAPEASSFTMLASGAVMGLVGWARRRRKRAKQARRAAAEEDEVDFGD